MSCVGGEYNGYDVEQSPSPEELNKPTQVSMKQCNDNGGDGLVNNGHGGLDCNGGKYGGIYSRPAR